MLIRMTQLDYDREVAFIATVDSNGEEIEIGVARYFTNPDGQTAEFALVIADEWQRRGLGTRLMTCLIDAAREKGFKALQGEVLATNTKMISLMKRLEFITRIKTDDQTLYIVIKLL